MPNACSPRSVLRRLPAGLTDEAFRSCQSEVIIEAMLRELREDLSRVDRMIRVLEWAEVGVENHRAGG